jgi:hypothetical protein
MWRFRCASALLVVLLSLAAPRFAQADPIVVDQSFEQEGDLSSLINECCRYVAQTFTAGLVGDLVGVKVDVFANQNLGQTFPLNVRLTRVVGDAGIPTLDTLAQAVVASGESRLDTPVFFNRAVPLRPGDRFAIVVSYDAAPTPGAGGTGIGTWAGSTHDPYGGGQSFLSFTGAGWFSDSAGFDSSFATLVDTRAATPEPASVTLLCAALAASVGRGLRKQKRPRKRGLV